MSVPAPPAKLLSAKSINYAEYDKGITHRYFSISSGDKGFRTEEAGVMRLVGLYGTEERVKVRALEGSGCEDDSFGENWGF